MINPQEHPWKILLVEDDEDDFILARAWLSVSTGNQFSLKWAPTYEEALKSLSQPEEFDAVLIDYDLGAHTGVELVREMKKNSCHIPAILLTGRGSYNVDLEAMKAGADDYLAKSEVTPLLLERTIRYAIERRHIEDSLRRSNEELEQRVQARTAELQQAVQELSESENRLRTLVNNAPVILWATDQEGIFTLWEGKIAVESGRQSGGMVGKPIEEFAGGGRETRASFKKAMHRQGMSASISTHEGRAYKNRFLPRLGPGGEVLGLIGVSTDVTDQMLAESQRLYQAHLLEHVNDAVIASDKNLVITSWNPAAEKIYGWKATEVIGQGARFNHTQWVGATGEELAKHIQEHGFYQCEDIQPRKDGELIYVSVKAAPLLDEHGNLIGYVSVNRDITGRKKIEAELEEVRQKLFNRNEAERLELAQEIHDGPMQDLYSLVYQFQVLQDSLEDPQWKETAELAQETLEKVIEELRTTAYTLRPPALAPFGLQKAIQSHAEQFRQNHPELVLQLELQPDRQTLSEDVRLALFRIYQMAMTNVVRHASASQVLVRFHFDQENIVLEVQDNGVGFDAGKRWIELAREGHLGLIGASERAEAVGGRLEVQSASGKGALIRAVVPKKATKEKPAPA